MNKNIFLYFLSIFQFHYCHVQLLMYYDAKMEILSMYRPHVMISKLKEVKNTN